MRAKWLYGLIALIALAAGVAVQRWMAAEPTAPLSEPAAPMAEPVLRDLDGKTHTLAEWRGKLLVLNFWATWCPPCREEMPEFVRLQNELGGQGLQFVGVAIDEPDEVRAFLKDNPVNYPILIGDERAPDWADSLGNRLSALPFSVVFDRGGKIIHTQTGVFRREQVLDAVRTHLNGQSAGRQP
jgi:thiol-disulfide isomerase/thioredoxin